MKSIKIILFSLLLLKSSFSIAQKDSVTNKKVDRFYISLTGGISIPVGSFAKKDHDPNYTPNVKWPVSFNMAGSAKPGIEGRLNASWFFLNQLGCIATFYTNSYKTGHKTLKEVTTYAMNQNYQNREYSYDPKPWTTHGYMIGLAVRIPLDKSAFSLKFLAGSQHSVLPEINIIITDNPDNGSYVQTENITQLSASSTDFAWNAGIDYKIRLGKYLAVLCSADYTSSSAAEYSGKDLITWQAYDNGVPYYFHSDYIDSFKHTKKITYVSVTTGIAYIFK